MEKKMESEQSASGSSSSSSESSSGSSEGEEEALETVRILGQTVEIPQDICEDYSIFKEFFSMKTWNALEDSHKEHLMKYLPKFTENDKEEKEKTLKMLFDHEPFHFTSPLDNFYNNLNQGNYRPDIAKMRKFLKKASLKQQKHKLKSYYAKLLPEVLISRERLLAVAKGAPPGPIPRLPLLPPKPSSKNNFKSVQMRARQRYFEELAAIRTEVGGEESDDENYPDGPPEQAVKKRKPTGSIQSHDGNVSGTLGSSDSSQATSLECLKNILSAHRLRRMHRENHPELNTTGITLEDIKQRVALVNGAKKLMFGGQKTETPLQKLRRGPKKDKAKEVKSKKGKEEVLLEGPENRPLLPNIKIKCEQEESDSESSSFVDPVASPKYSKQLLENHDIKPEIDVKYPNTTNMNFNDSKLEDVIKQEPPDPVLAMQNAARVLQPVPIKLEDLDGIDMMALPVEIADDSGEVLPVDSESAEEQLIDTDESLTETTHANFLSLVRALFPARAAHRASKQQLHSRCGAVMRSPIAPLNTWYSLSDDWCAELDSALDFLAGERGPHPDDFVPYLQFIPETQMYQWIGAGRDCDAILSRLCERWLRAATRAPPPTRAPPSRHPTNWVVRAPTAAEIAEFRAQERKRFASAAKPFTYVQYGYRSVVGPCARAAAGGAGAGGALAPARPRAASLPALLRDAIARLPNGQGTRHDILTLLKMSQWIVPCNDQTLLAAMSTALDRLNSAKRDPIVKYDQRTAIWTYLYRHRSEEDWLKASKSRASVSVPAASPPPAAAAPPAPPVATPTPTPTSRASTTPQPKVDLEIGTVEEVVENASDSDVDVDDTTVSSVSHLSSAQLLMQAQASQGKTQTTPPAAKPKGKLVAMPQKPKATTPKQAPKPTLMTQSVKQANLLNQAKQALAQTVKITQKQTTQAKINTPSKPTVTQSPKQPVVTQPKQSPTVPKTTVQTKQTVAKPIVQPKTVIKPNAQSPKTIAQVVKTTAHVIKAQVKPVQSQATGQTVTQVSKALPPVVATATKSPLIKQRPLLKVETAQVQIPVTTVQSQQVVTSTVVPVATVAAPQIQNKVVQGTRSLLIRPPAVQTTVTAVSTPTTQVQELLNALQSASRRGVVRVLSPAAQAAGKSLISPRALMPQGTTVANKKRTSMPNAASVTTIAQQSTATVTAVASSVVMSPGVTSSAVTSSSARGVTLPSRTVHIAPHALQLSSLQLSTRTVRLSTGQTVQLANPQAVRPISANVKTTPRTQSSPAIKNQVSTVQLSGQTVQIAGQTVQLAGQSVQLTGHTVKLPSGQSVQVASQSVLPSQSVQLPSGQTVQLSSGSVQTVQLGSNVQLANQSVQIPSAQIGSQTVQIGGQTVQLSGQTVQLPSGQTLQLSGQTVQLSGGQTIQLASGQTVQLANQTPKSIAQVVRTQTAGDKPAQPIVAKLLTNAQGQMISLEGVVGNRPPALQQLQQLQLQGPRARGAVRLLSPRPLLLTAGKPLHNIILQQSDGSAIRVTSSGGVTPSQTIVLSNIGGQAATTPTTSTPVLKLQQVNPIHQVKLAQGIKIQQVKYKMHDSKVWSVDVV
ncbi:nuclear factor related to kappa-B-binding protein isoform X2 [Amyelois transitella]|uniref:nuclear factor related to kappa-B-binding protein isoform X2 n=1 Tax=Amyelois transitella TaxID=680683 RepID=UPI00298F4EA4|nr:nuclear factor related to kappa-B-binding protein isoform X2 [Amyelois transitella]